ncbi:MAG: D-glycero-beta-D-manno-heptose 1-phosphate adenylyltransferase [Deltaproteobacteria bacterium]|nr:D-glycero-beta-D-manno-heptose 1-phosphate adenylyltransferase [Deltaproteobacteria bacterium]
MKYRFGVIGLGKVGSVLLTLLSQEGHTPVWTVSSQVLKYDIPVFPSVPIEPAGVDVVFISVPDSAIAGVAEIIAKRWGKTCRGICFYHFSGLFSSDLLECLELEGGEVASLHPLQSIVDMEGAEQAIRQCWFTSEGSKHAIEAAGVIVNSIGSRLINISKQDKIIYHTAAVIASNYLVSLVSQARQLIEASGMSMEHLVPLINSTVANIEKHGQSALTGPVQRGDWATVKAHIAELYERFPDILPSYDALGRYTARIAGRQWPEDIGLPEKLLDREQVTRRSALLKERGMNIVFTNGCFDILHEGHVSYLNQARSLGDVLVVGLNADESVTRLKGPGRPVNPQNSRAEVLAGLECVDYICIFDEDTPYELINQICPHILVKGGDWKIEDIVGSDIVRSHGGQVYSLSFVSGQSTSAVIQKIKEEHLPETQE